MGLKTNTYIRKHKGEPSTTEIRMVSVMLINFIRDYLYWKGKKKYSVCLRDFELHNEDFLFGFARGLMDTDGFVENYGVVSKNFIEDLRKILLKINIIPTIRIIKRDNRKDLHLLRVKKRDLKIYHKNIGFSNLRKRQKLIKIINK